MYNLEDDLGETNNLTETKPEVFQEINVELEKWEAGLIEPLWVEGESWNIVTWMIHEDLMNNQTIRVKNPAQLSRYQLTK